MEILTHIVINYIILLYNLLNLTKLRYYNTNRIKEKNITNHRTNFYIFYCIFYNLAVILK